jgi:hypothetical protein
MYWEFKFKQEPIKPYAKHKIVFRVKTFVSSSERINGKVKKDRIYIGTIKIYDKENTDLSEESFFKVFSHFRDVLCCGNYSAESINNFLEKGREKFNKRYNEESKKALEEIEEEFEIMMLGAMAKKKIQEIEANEANESMSKGFADKINEQN